MVVIRLRRQRIVTYMVLLAVSLLLYVMIYGGRNESERKRAVDDQEIIKRLLEKVRQKANDLKIAKIERNENRRPHVVDEDHPEAERVKAEMQENDVKGKIQVEAPLEINPNAPGRAFNILKQLNVMS
jgi:hypothetical protein